MPPDEPNVLVLLSSQHNHRVAAGGPVATPTLDGLAESGTRFERAYAPATADGPARLCTLTGQHVPGCRAWDEGSPLRPVLSTLGGAFSAAGYETCLVGSTGIGGDRQFAGFDRRPYGDFTGTGGHQFDPLPNPKARGSPGAASGDATGGRYGHRYDPQAAERRAPDPWRSLAGDAGVTTVPESRHQERTVVEETVSFLREHRHRDPDRPWLVCASVSRPHPPLTAPKRHLERGRSADDDGPRVGPAETVAHPVVEAKRTADATADLPDADGIDPTDPAVVERTRAAYFACVAYLDEILGDVLARLDREGFLEDTIVVYASDHGDMLGEHGMWDKGIWYEGSTRVPFLIELPDHRAGERESGTVETPVSLIDLYPTLCGLAGVDVPADLDGVDLSAAVRDGGSPDRRPVAVDHLRPRWGEGTEFRAVRDGSHKYVRFRDAPDLLFDLAADPGETDDRSGAEPSTADRLARGIDESVDFDAVARRRERDRADRRELPVTRGTSGNAFLLDDRRLIDADAGLYRPNEIAKDAAVVLADWPDAPDE